MQFRKLRNVWISMTYCGTTSLLFLVNVQIMINSRKNRKIFWHFAIRLLRIATDLPSITNGYLLSGVFYNRCLVYIDGRGLQSIFLDACGSDISSAWIHTKRRKQFLSYEDQWWLQNMSRDCHFVRFEAKSEIPLLISGFHHALL